MNIRKTSIIVAGIAAAGLLTACGGGTDHDGEYIRHDGGQLMSLVIDGDEVTHLVLDCQSEPKHDQSVGELSDDRTSINWTASAGRCRPCHLSVSVEAGYPCRSAACRTVVSTIEAVTRGCADRCRA